VELILEIAEHLDFPGFLSMRQANVRLSNILAIYSASAIPNLWRRTLGSCYNEAVTFHRSPGLVRQEQISSVGLQHWVQAHLLQLPQPVAGMQESHDLQRLHVAVEFLTAQISETLLRSSWADLQRDIRLHPMTSPERDRVRRSLYRLEMLSRLFGNSMRTGRNSPTTLLRPVVAFLRTLFADSEMSQMHSVGVLLEDGLCRGNLLAPDSPCNS
jgi:hypothetical protein